MRNLLKDLRVMRALCLATLLVVCNSYATAQSAPQDRFANQSAGDLLKAYNDGTAGSAQRQEYLFGMLDKGLPASDTNIAAVRKSLAGAGDTEDKALLTKVLASMYMPRVRSQANLQIEDDIKKLIASGDKRLATIAAFAYSRLAYPSDRYAVLRQAHVAKLFNDDAYFGELAHGLRFAAFQEQAQMLDELDNSHNVYSAEILAATFGSPEPLSQLSPPARTRVLQILSSREPVFPMALDAFGAVDVIRYAEWLSAVATIEATTTGKPYADVAVERLSGANVDPRKILAFFGNPEGQRAIAETKDPARLRVLLNGAQGYARSLPQNVMLNGAAESFSQRMTRAGPTTALRN